MKQVWVDIVRWNKEIAIAALESGADAVLLKKGDSEKARTLGRITIVAEDGDIVIGKDVVPFEINSKADEEKAATMHRDSMLLLRMRDWTIIPIENLLAKRERIMTEVRNVDEARTMIGILEKGVDGVVIKTSSPEQVRKVVELVHGLAPDMDLLPASITRIEPSGMGDRVCIDTCSNMLPGEGMLIGNTSSAFFLVHSESIENPYVAARPFRVNASAVHAYALKPGNATSYLSDLRVGDEVMVVDAGGKTRSAHIGRCKVESRPMVLVFAEVSGKEISVYLQNAETINLVGCDGKPISVSKLKPGDQVLVHLESGGRHFGMKIEETLIER